MNTIVQSVSNFSANEWRRVDSEIKVVCERHMRTVPVSVGRIAGELELEVSAATLPSGVSGEIRPHPTRDGFLIRVNRHEARVRQRFTVAHEVAHFLLHRDFIQRGVIDSVMYRSQTLSSKQEAEANRIAADLLMPRKTISALITSKGLNGIDRSNVDFFAKYLKVSRHALEIRYGLVD